MGISQHRALQKIHSPGDCFQFTTIFLRLSIDCYWWWEGEAFYIDLRVGVLTFIHLHAVNAESEQYRVDSSRISDINNSFRSMHHLIALNLMSQQLRLAPSTITPLIEIICTTLAVLDALINIGMF